MNCYNSYNIILCCVSWVLVAINGYVSETLPGLIVEQYQMTRWHLLNVGSQGEFHAVHFHGLPFGVGKDQEHRMGIFNLYPGKLYTNPSHGTLHAC